MKPVVNQKGMNMDNLSNEDVVLDKLEEMMTWNGFARSLVNQHLAKGRLSPNQWAAAERMIAKMAANKVARDAKSIDVNVGKINDLLVHAKVKRPVFRAEGLKFSLAPVTLKNGQPAANAGAVYVKAGDEYQGKISGGKFHAGRDCLDDTPQAVVRAAQDPRGVAVQYGRDTGICACCGRTLTDPVSIEMGIGPICAEKWGL